MATTTIDQQREARKGKVIMETQIEAQFEVVSPEKTDAIERTTPMAPVAITHIASTPMSILDKLVDRGGSLEQIEKFLELMRQQEARDAKRAYTEAMSEFKAHSIQVVKDKSNKQYDSKYVSLGRLVSTVTPFLSQHGLSANWDVDQSKPPAIIVTCKMTHKAGHSESVSMTLPPDKSGSKNPIQEIKSSITYGKACTFESICGLASTDANLDDDGNGAGGGGGEQGSAEGQFDYEELRERIEHFKNCLNPKEVTDHFNASWKEVYSSGDLEAQRAIVNAKDAALKAFKKAGVR